MIFGGVDGLYLRMPTSPLVRIESRNVESRGGLPPLIASTPAPVEDRPDAVGAIGLGLEPIRLRRFTSHRAR